MVNLTAFYVSRVEASKKHEFNVHAYPTSLCCRADTESEMMEWLNIFQQPLFEEGCAAQVGSRVDAADRTRSRRKAVTVANLALVPSHYQVPGLAWGSWQATGPRNG